MDLNINWDIFLFSAPVAEATFLFRLFFYFLLLYMDVTNSCNLRKSKAKKGISRSKRH